MLIPRAAWRDGTVRTSTAPDRSPRPAGGARALAAPRRTAAATGRRP
ncbi:hypothetical protein ACWEGQ_37100 [Streptomyces seoulensis]